MSDGESYQSSDIDEDLEKALQAVCIEKKKPARKPPQKVSAPLDGVTKTGKKVEDLNALRIANLKKYREKRKAEIEQRNESKKTMELTKKEIAERKERLISAETLLQAKQLEKLEARLAKKIQNLAQSTEVERNVKKVVSVVTNKPTAPQPPPLSNTESIIMSFLKGDM
jgi:hypothetical protein